MQPIKKRKMQKEKAACSCLFFYPVSLIVVSNFFPGSGGSGLTVESIEQAQPFPLVKPAATSGSLHIIQSCAEPLPEDLDFPFFDLNTLASRGAEKKLKTTNNSLENY